MPYNTTAIPKRDSDELTGSSVLPLARIKKIIKLDEDIDACTPGAIFLITLATEMFVQHLTEHGYAMTRSERKPRKNMQYKDLANAVARMDSLEFLSDVVPKTMTYNKAIDTKIRNQARKDAEAAAKTSEDVISPNRRTNGVHAVEGDIEHVISGKAMSSDDEDEEPQSRRPNVNGTQNGTSAEVEDDGSGGDIEMAT